MDRYFWSVITLLMLAVAPVIGESAVLCTNSSGSVFLRSDACNNNETQLDMDDLGLVIPPPNDAFTAKKYNLTLTSSPTTVARLTVGPGAYNINAYAYLDHVSTEQAYRTNAVCSIYVGSSYVTRTYADGVAIELPLKPVGYIYVVPATLSFNSVANLSQDGYIFMDCSYASLWPETQVTIRALRITAVRAASLTDQSYD